MRATSPNGSAAYEGRVQWSGELGYGVRSPEQGQAPAADLTPPTDVPVTSEDVDPGTLSEGESVSEHEAPGGH
jgi:NADH-quinone oxidoreductase subunit I